MGNLLLPVAVRLESLKRQAPPSLLPDLETIENCVAYLQRLIRGLRMLSIDPADTRGSAELSDLQAWRKEVEPLLRSAVPRTVTLDWRLPEDLPPLRIARHLMTQAVLNLVQNAGDATAARGGGAVRIWAEAAAGGRSVRLGVSDEGIGMREDVRRRCVDPFFTTKPRSISTGLGLTLVLGIARSAGGSLDIESQPQRGSTFILTLPAAPPSGSASPPAPPRRAAVTLSDGRRRSYVMSVLRGLEFDPSISSEAPPEDAAVWVADFSAATHDGARAFAGRKPGRRVLLLGAPERDLGDPRLVGLEDKASVGHIRRTLQEFAKASAAQES
jgi:hypothetical protein